ncbi:YbjN domain-containing protein [Rothia sp. P5764]|uniref:YbjN domain-containing protein n=1 Tax=Rothia sp. P5764 TaxID=3402654 RepID=UPI003AC90922
MAISLTARQQKERAPLGFFDSVQPAPATPAPLTSTRLGQALRRLEIPHELEADGTPITYYPAGYLLYLLTPDRLTVRTTWRQSLPTSSLPHLSMFAHQWNQHRPYPTAYPAILGEDGQDFALLPADFTLPVTAGATDEQIDLYLREASRSAQEFLTEVEGAFEPITEGE